MANAWITGGSMGSTLGNPLSSMLTANEIIPGHLPSYTLCKNIAAYHTLGRKLSHTPIEMAMHRPREIVVGDGPGEMLKEAFDKQWAADQIDKHVLNIGGQARIYGISSIALMVKGMGTDVPADYMKLWKEQISFNVLDPLNTAGSLVLNQDPNSIDYQRVGNIRVSGQVYHRSRSVTLLHEDPLYIEYTSSAFGFVGRSVYQRCLYPLKTFLQTLRTDDMISLKVGVLIAKTKAPGSFIDQPMEIIAGIKRAYIQEAVTNNVITIDREDAIESIDMVNLDAPYKLARTNCIENVATGSSMPAIIINSETFAEGFGEGTEDAKYVNKFIEGQQRWLGPVYGFMDRITMHRAWNEQFYKTVQNKFPEEYGDVPYEEAFYRWANSFKAPWPNLDEEPDSEKIKVEAVRIQAAIDLFSLLVGTLDPDNKIVAITFLVDNFNSMKLMLAAKLDLDYDALLDFLVEQKDQADEQSEAQLEGMAENEEGGEGGGKMPSPVRRVTAADSATVGLGLIQAIQALPDLRRRRMEARANERGGRRDRQAA